MSKKVSMSSTYFSWFKQVCVKWPKFWMGKSAWLQRSSKKFSVLVRRYLKSSLSRWSCMSRRLLKGMLQEQAVVEGYAAGAGGCWRVCCRSRRLLKGMLQEQAVVEGYAAGAGGCWRVCCCAACPLPDLVSLSFAAAADCVKSHTAHPLHITII